MSACDWITAALVAYFIGTCFGWLFVDVAMDIMGWRIHEVFGHPRGLYDYMAYEKKGWIIGFLYTNFSPPIPRRLFKTKKPRRDA